MWALKAAVEEERTTPQKPDLLGCRALLAACNGPHGTSAWQEAASVAWDC